MTGDRRNDGTHFPYLNGRGHVRRPSNESPEYAYQMDVYELRALAMISALDHSMHVEQVRDEAEREGWRGLGAGEPGE